MKEFIKKNIKYFCQGSLRFEFGEIVVYTDPYRIDKNYNDADIILITHPHHDHLSDEDIKKVIKEDTIIIAGESFIDEIKGYTNIMGVMPGSEMNILGVGIKAVPAYNIVKTSCHNKKNNWVGYVLEYKDKTFYYTSDTEYIPEMDEIEADVIFLPLGQTYTMECVEDAVKAVEAVGAKYAVPVHYGLYEGTEEDADKFIELVGEKGIRI